MEVISDRRVYNQAPMQQQQPPPQFDSYDGGGFRSNSFENLAPVVDPSLANILRRPPVGVKTPFPPSHNMGGSGSGRVQFNESTRYQQYSPQPQSFQMDPQMMMMMQQQPAQNSYAQSNSILNSSNLSKSQMAIHNPATVSKDAAGFNFSEDQNKDIKAMKAKAYQDVLQQQVRENQLKKQKEKENQRRQDEKISMENASYNPFGRGGAGAPIRDREGNIVADLKQVRADPENFSPRSLSQPPLNNSFRQLPPQQQQQLGYASSGNSNNNLLMMMPPNNNNNNNQALPQRYSPPNDIFGGLGSGRKAGDDATSFTRGGNGLFGEAKVTI